MYIYFVVARLGKYNKALLKIKTCRPGLRSNNRYKAAPVLWNNLTEELTNTHKLETFKSGLKTKLFKDYY